MRNSVLSSKVLALVLAINPPLRGQAMLASRIGAVWTRNVYDIRFSNVQEGGLVAFDMMAIPKDASHPEAALKWISYIEGPEVNAAINSEVYYPSANVPACVNSIRLRSRSVHIQEINPVARALLAAHSSGEIGFGANTQLSTVFFG